MMENLHATFQGTRKVQSVHPAADLYPMMDHDQLAALVDDLATHGMKMPVVITPDNRVLDGRNRIVAAQSIGVEIRYEVYEGDSWLYALRKWLISKGPLTVTQRAILAGRLTHAMRSSEHTIDTKTVPTKLQLQGVLDLSGASVHRGSTLVRIGSPSLVAAVYDGLVPLATGTRVVTHLDARHQDLYAERVRRGRDPVATATDMGVPSDHTPVENPKPKPAPITPAVKRATVASRVHNEPDPGTANGKDLERIIHAVEGMTMSFDRFPRDIIGVSEDDMVNHIKSMRRLGTSLFRFRKFLETTLEGKNANNS